MPTYLFRNKQTGDEFTEFMSISSLNEYLSANPDVEQLINGAPAIGDSIRLGLRKPDDTFRDHLKEMKKKHSQGISRSTIQTF